MAGLNAIDDSGGGGGSHGGHSSLTKKKMTIPIIAAIGIGGAILIYFMMRNQNSATTAAANTTTPNSSILSSPLDPTSESEAALATENLSGQMGNLLSQISTENAAITAQSQGGGTVSLGAPGGDTQGQQGIWQNSVAAYSSPSAKPSDFLTLPYGNYTVEGPSVPGWAGTGGLTPVAAPGGATDYIENQNINAYGAPQAA